MSDKNDQQNQQEEFSAFEDPAPEDNKDQVGLKMDPNLPGKI